MLSGALRDAGDKVVRFPFHSGRGYQKAHPATLDSFPPVWPGLSTGEFSLPPIFSLGQSSTAGAGPPPPYGHLFGFSPVNGPSETMSDHPTREEVRAVINDKLEAVEARSDGKFIEVNGKLDRLADQVGAVVSQLGAIRDDNKNTRITVIVTAVASVLAIVGILLTAQANLLSAFQTGLTALSTVHPTAASSGPPPQDAGPKNQR